MKLSKQEINIIVLLILLVLALFTNPKSDEIRAKANKEQEAYFDNIFFKSPQEGYYNEKKINAVANFDRSLTYC